MNDHFDVFIIGGGMAGLNMARLLIESTSLKVGIADTGIRSEKNNPARLTFKDTITDNGLSDCVLNEYNSFGIFTYHGAQSVHEFHEPTFVALDYNRACAKLLNTIKLADQITYYHERVVHLEIKKEHAEIKLRSGLSLTAKLVADTSGKAHFALEKLAQEKPKLYSHSFGRSFKNCRIDKTDVVYFIGSSVDYGSGGGWYYPIDQKRASVGFAVITENVKFPARELREKFNKAIREVEPICTFLRQAKPAAFEIGTIPIQPVPQPFGNRLLMVGDSAGQATSWMCMGVEPALANSQLAVQTIIQSFKINNFSKKVLHDYKKAWDVKNKKIFAHIEEQKTKIWFLGEDVWDFILEKDLNKLSPQQLFARVKSNAHLMSFPVAMWRWIIFRLQHLKDRNKYKQHRESQ